VVVEVVAQEQEYNKDYKTGESDTIFLAGMHT